MRWLAGIATFTVTLAIVLTASPWAPPGPTMLGDRGAGPATDVQGWILHDVARTCPSDTPGRTTCYTVWWRPIVHAGSLVPGFYEATVYLKDLPAANGCWFLSPLETTCTNTADSARRSDHAVQRVWGTSVACQSFEAVLSLEGVRVATDEGEVCVDLHAHSW